MSKPASRPTWAAVKAKLATFDRAGLESLVKDLYAAHKDHQTFLHTRLGLGEDVLKPYRETITRWISPDVYRNQRPSVATAKQAIFDYKKACGDPAGAAELMVYYCELAADFANSFGEDEPYFNALLNMFEQALATIDTLPSDAHKPLLLRLAKVRDVSHHFGYSVGDYMDDMLGQWEELDETEPET
jgi:hypothetical protein